MHNIHLIFKGPVSHSNVYNNENLHYILKNYFTFHQLPDSIQCCKKQLKYDLGFLFCGVIGFTYDNIAKKMNARIITIFN